MSEESFLREVEEELRSDKLKAFWKRYAPFIIGAAVLIVLIVAANEAWKWWRDSSAAEASERYYAAIALAEQGTPAEAQAALEAIAADNPGGYGILAQFRAASLLAEQGDPDAAISAYDALSSSLNDIRLRELALILGAYLAVDHLDVAGVEARAGTLTGEESPLRNQAREALGLAYFKTGDLEAASANFEAIAADQTVGQEMQLRVHIYLEQLASAGIESASEAEPEPVE